MDIGTVLMRRNTSMRSGNNDSSSAHHLSENDFDSFMASSTTAYIAEVTSLNHSHSQHHNSSSSSSSDISVAGMEQANLLFNIVTESNKLMRKSPVVTVLGLFCCEGDNRPDGTKLGFLALSLLCPKYAVDKEHSMLHPASWNVLYGSSICEDSLSMIY